jgi:hypothetical protein
MLIQLTQKDGYEFAKGFIQYVGRVLVILWLMILVIDFCADRLDIGVDDSDKDGMNRSGLNVHVDAKTGIEYLSTKGGGLVRRETK